MHRLLNFFVTAPSTGRPRFISASIIPHFMLGLAISVMLFVCTAQARAQVTLLPTDDAYIDDGTSGSPAPNVTNYGSATTLKVKTAGSYGGSNRDAYLRFDISGFATISTATLALYASLSGTTSSSIDMNVYSVSDTSWSEQTLTSSNNLSTPGGGTNQTSPSITIMRTGSPAYKNITLTGYFAGRLSNHITQVSIDLHNPSGSNDLIVINSKEAGSSPPTLTIAGTLNPPQNLTATPGNSKVVLTWIAPRPDPSGTAITYTLYKSTTPGGTSMATGSPITSGITVDPQHPTQLSYQDSSVTNNTTYYYRIAAVTGGNTSAKSDPETSGAMPQSGLPAPTTFTAIPGNGQVKLTWSAVSSAASYNLYRKSDYSGDPVDYTIAGAPPYKTGLTATTYVDLGRMNGQSYTYKVVPVRSDGNAGSEKVSNPVTPLVTMHSTLSQDTYVDNNMSGSPVPDYTNYGLCCINI